MGHTQRRTDGTYNAGRGRPSPVPHPVSRIPYPIGVGCPLGAAFIGGFNPDPISRIPASEGAARVSAEEDGMPLPIVSWNPLRYVNAMIDEGRPTLEEVCAEARDLGLDHVEFHYGVIPSHD